MIWAGRSLKRLRVAARVGVEALARPWLWTSVLYHDRTYELHTNYEKLYLGN